ncbi:PIN domain-containing protein [Spirosoma soli]|uniref:PIN domain-containing protein n=1 Tax=Spirosoma soli TaxID=1770529 RepID=A0ABW5M1V4_9BACT
MNAVGIRSCYLSEITIAELLYGIENSAPTRRSQNQANLDWLQTAFTGRILRIGSCFHEYARQKAALKRLGRPVGEFDLLIGATAVVHGLTLITRNVRDFENLEHIRLENWIDS